MVYLEGDPRKVRKWDREKQAANTRYVFQESGTLGHYSLIALGKLV